MKHIIENIKKFFKHEVPSEKINQTKSDIKHNKWQQFKNDVSLDKVQIPYLALDISFSFFLAYALVNLLPLSNDLKAYVGFSIFYITLPVMASPTVYNLLLSAALFVSSIFSKAETETENKADRSTFQLKTSIIPANHYLLTFISVYFPSFVILYCMKFSGVNWNAVYYSCILFIIPFIELAFFNIGTYFLLKRTWNRAFYYNLTYNSVK